MVRRWVVGVSEMGFATYEALTLTGVMGVTFVGEAEVLAVDTVA